ncbi:MAG TPA: hypothetical protein VHG33_02350 [Woeseiaceae bacterium]|nr:hypothetical protein [Woeseiaceae bacterium]
MAQQSAVESCREAGADAERIACLEAALTGSSRQPETPAAEPSLPPSAGQETTPVEAPPEISESKPAEGTEAADSIGARQVRARQRSAADLESARGLRVARYDTVPFRRLQVELENGQVWRQIEGDTQRVRVDLERNRTVDIEESALGGYKLRLNEIARTIRVERIR